MVFYSYLTWAMQLVKQWEKGIQPCEIGNAVLHSSAKSNKTSKLFNTRSKQTLLQQLDTMKGI